MNSGVEITQHLSAAVMLRIRYYENNGLPENYRARLGAFAQTLAEKGDFLLFAPQTKQEKEMFKYMFGELTFVLAVLSFNVCGIRFGEMHFQGKLTIGELNLSGVHEL